MMEHQQVCCYKVEDQHICKKPLLDDSEVWLRLMEQMIASRGQAFDIIEALGFADWMLAEFKKRFRSETANG